MSKSIRPLILLAMSLSLVGLFGCKESSPKFSVATTEANQEGQSSSSTNTPDTGVSSEASSATDPMSASPSTKEQGSQADEVASQAEESTPPAQESVPQAGETSSQAEAPASQNQEPAAQAENPVQGGQIKLDQVTLEEVALPENLLHVKLENIEGEGFFDAFAFDGKEFKLSLSAVPMTAGSAYGQTQAMYSFNPSSGEVKEEMDLRGLNTRVFNPVFFEGKVYLLCLARNQATVISYGEDHKLNEVVSLPALDNPNQVPVLTRLEDDLLLIAPKVEGEKSSLAVYSLKSGEAKLVCEEEYSFAFEPNQPAESIIRLEASHGNQIFAFMSEKIGTEEKHLNIVEHGKIRKVALDQAYTRIFTSGNKVILIRDGESQPSGQNPVFVRVYDASQDSFGEEVMLENEIQRCLGLGDGAFLFTLANPNNGQPEAKLATTDGNNFQLVKDLGPTAGPGSIVRTSQDTACIYCQDRSGGQAVQKLYLVHLEK